MPEVMEVEVVHLRLYRQTSPTGRMLGIRQPLDGPIFEKLEHAEYWCWHAMLDHYERGLGMSVP